VQVRVKLDYVYDDASDAKNVTELQKLIKTEEKLGIKAAQSDQLNDAIANILQLI